MQDQNQIQNINIGSTIGLSFDLGKFQHPVYGNADLSGTIPLVLPYETYVEPAIIKEPKGLEAMVAKLIPEFRDLWNNELDKEVCAKITDCVLVGSYINPIDNITTKQMETFLYLMCLTSAVDDKIDNIKEFSNKGFRQDMIRNYRKSRSHVFNMVIEGTINDIENPIPAFEFIRPYGKKLMKLFESSFPDFHKNNQYFKKEIFDGGRTVLLNSGQFSHTNKSLFNGYQTGMLPMLEFLVLIRGVKVSDKIRNDMLFQRMRIAFSTASHLMNDILGCGRDIHLNQVHDSSILFQVVHKGIPLQDVFDQTLTELNHEINDIRIAGKKLRQYYWDDKDLLEYISCTENMLDGQLYAYKQVHRYGDLNMKIVSN